MRAAQFAFVLSALAAACSSSSQEPRNAEPPELVVSGSCRHQEDMRLLAVAVANRGRGPSAPAVARVDFDGASAAGIVRHTRYIAAHAVDTFEVELPDVCSKIACRWNITVDSVRPVRESGRC